MSEVVVVDVPMPRNMRMEQFRQEVGAVSEQLRLLLGERPEIIDRELPRLWDRLNRALVESQPGGTR